MGILTKYFKKIQLRTVLVEELKKTGVKVTKGTVDDTVDMVLLFDKAIKHLQKRSLKKNDDESKYMYLIAHNMVADIDEKLLLPKLSKIKLGKKDNSPSYIG